MKLLLLSDIHCQFEEMYQKSVAHGDVDAILCAGDFTWRGRDRHKEVSRTRKWVQKMAAIAPFYWIPGNHDIRFMNEFYNIPNTIKCKDETVKLGDYTLHGVSLSPCYDRPDMAVTWDFMTNNPVAEEAAFDFEPVDIVLSHCPPLGVLDKTLDHRYIGSEFLLKYIDKHEPLLVVCGHVHEAAGHVRHKKTDVHNVALTTRVIHLP
jgi:hypothetical protein